MPRALTDPAELRARLRLPLVDQPAVEAAAQRFPLKISPALAERLVGAAPDDPLLRQFMPSADELVEEPGPHADLYRSDPVGDLQAQRAPGLLHKYRGRALVIASAACPVHCRYCFRREYPYAAASATNHWDQVVSALRGDPTIHEVLLSGGDPLSLSNRALARMVADLAEIPHLRRLRVHTRFPTVAPDRVDDPLLRLLSGPRFAPVVMVLHVNHADELDIPGVDAALSRLRGAGLLLFAQSVLLRGVNDREDALAQLCERLVERGVVPYYLHLLDRVRGAAHFEVPEPEAVQLVQALIRRLPGYMVPRLVREIAGEPAKTPIPVALAAS
jgi:EF-P beta-lysylation protein EpmB